MRRQWHDPIPAVSIQQVAVVRIHQFVEPTHGPDRTGTATAEHVEPPFSVAPLCNEIASLLQLSQKTIT
jgi:hypothetical protein